MPLRLWRIVQFPQSLPLKLSLGIVLYPTQDLVCLNPGLAEMDGEIRVVLRMAFGVEDTDAILVCLDDEGHIWTPSDRHFFR